MVIGTWEWSARLIHPLIWPVLRSAGEWRLTVDHCGLNEVTQSLSAAVLDMPEPQ